MNKTFIFNFLVTIIPFFVMGQDLESDGLKFEEIDGSHIWTLQLEDTGKEDWKKHWFLDGDKGSVVNSEEGMYLRAGPEQGNDAHHAVLWTKDSFKGNIKIEYDYTKTDTLERNVNILYIQATGIGKPPFSKDIYEWKALRKVPKMSTYFENMNAFHISYAAISYRDSYTYVRARRYPVTAKRSFQKTMIEPSFNNETDTFKNGITYKITTIKTEDNLLFKVVGDGGTKVFSWNISNWELIEEGRIGFRHMFTRSARYKNIKIYTDADSSSDD